MINRPHTPDWLVFGLVGSAVAWLVFGIVATNKASKEYLMEELETLKKKENDLLEDLKKEETTDSESFKISKELTKLRRRIDLIRSEIDESA